MHKKPSGVWIMAYTTIDKPTDYFETKLHTGNGGTQSITGLDFAPNWVWLKSRSAVEGHSIFDTVRGVQKRIGSNGADAENDQSSYLTAFGTEGFTVGSSGLVNSNSTTYVSWNWLASNTTASNTDGSITSTVSANTTSGFSIVSYTGTGSNATVGHGLGSAPAFIIFKDRSTTKDWFVYHQSISPATGGKLNLTVNPSADSSYFQNTAPTSSVFSIGTANTVNPSGNNMIGYCFSEVKSFSKFGSYVGNGSSDGSFIYTGQKSAFIIIKNTSTSGTNWVMFDNKRIGYNESNYYLRPSGSNTESTNIPLDILSNGFKIRTSAGDVNTSGNTYIYMCFASNPFVTSTGIPTTAR
jgi:hypothetical protein